MINEQVRKYFYDRRLLNIYKVVRESLGTVDLNLAGRIYQLLTEGLGITFNIDNDDREWIHDVRVLFRRRYPNDMKLLPRVDQLLAARYALLHSGPHLHHYELKEMNPSKKDDWVLPGKGDGRLYVVEKLRIGGGARFNYKMITPVEALRDAYEKANKSLPTGDPREVDRQVGEWWIEENKDVIHNYKDKRKKDGEAPKQSIKIVDREPNHDSVVIAFKARDTSKWMPLEIPMDLESFREKAERQGYVDRKHGQHIVHYKSWDEPFKKEADFEPADDLGVRRPTFKKEKFNIAHEEADEDPSEVFQELYKRDVEFQGYVDKVIVGAVVTAVKFHTSAEVSIDRGSDMTQHKIFIRKNPYGVSITAQTVEDLLHDTYIKLVNASGGRSDEEWKDWKNYLKDEPMSAAERKEDKTLRGWLHLKANSFAKSAAQKALGKNTKGGAGSVIAQGSGQPGAGKGGKDREGGHEDLAAYSGAAKGNVAREKETAVRKDINDEERQDMQAAIMQALRDPETLRDNPGLVARIKKLAQEDPRIGDVLKHMNINLDQLGQEEEEDNEGPGTFGKYDRVGVRQETINPYSFHSYLQKKFNETGVSWGNDKKSAKIIKPGQTLKGGIQVQGAPWTAGGGPNYDGNDVKIKH